MARASDWVATVRHSDRSRTARGAHLGEPTRSFWVTPLPSAGTSACADLARKMNAENMVSALKARHLSPYEAYLAIILAAQYQCPARIPEATAVMAGALNRLPATS
jgi:hypothetical protein